MKRGVLFIFSLSFLVLSISNVSASFTFYGIEGNQPSAYIDSYGVYHLFFNNVTMYTEEIPTFYINESGSEIFEEGHFKRIIKTSGKISTTFEANSRITSVRIEFEDEKLFGEIDGNFYNYSVNYFSGDAFNEDQVMGLHGKAFFVNDNNDSFYFEDSRIEWRHYLNSSPLNYTSIRISLDLGNKLYDSYEIKKRFFVLESWKEILENALQSVQESITDIIFSINNLNGHVGNLEGRIESLENQNFSQPNITISDYWKYMSSSDRKNIVCGIATDEHLNTLTMQALGWKCDVTYRQTSKGEKASCKCARL